MSAFDPTLLTAGTISGVVMMTAAIETGAAAGPENITILYDAFGSLRAGPRKVPEHWSSVVRR
ncbi:MAG: hypothetical protein WAM76_19055 [Pseudolabrys sp.]|jgi:hypothetical protein